MPSTLGAHRTGQAREGSDAEPSHRRGPIGASCRDQRSLRSARAIGTSAFTPNLTEWAGRVVENSLVSRTLPVPPVSLLDSQVVAGNGKTSRLNVAGLFVGIGGIELGSQGAGHATSLLVGELRG